MNRRHLLQILAAPPVVVGLAGCSGLLGPQVITLGEPELAALMGRAFPQTRRVLEVLEVELSTPQLRLLPDRNRLAVVLTLRTRERLLGSAGRGQISFDSALRYEPRDASLRLTQVRVQQIGFETGAAGAGKGADVGPAGAIAGSPPGSPPGGTGAPGVSGASGGAQRLGIALAEAVLENLSLYRLSVERQASLRQVGLQPGAVTVTSRGVEITLARAGG